MVQFVIVRALLAFGCVLAVACGGDDSSGNNPNTSDGGGPGSDGGGPGDDGSVVGQDAAPPPPPKPICDLPAKPVDTSKPTTVVGDGSAGSCTDAAFRSAVATGGIVTFNCGANPVTVTVASEVPVGKDTTIDGGGKVTLSGGNTSRILHITSAWNVPTPLLTVQNLTFTGGFTSDVANTKSTTHGGGAIFQMPVSAAKAVTARVNQQKSLENCIRAPVRIHSL